MRIIAGNARGRRIDAPAGNNTRPTLDRVRENLFNMIQTRIEGAKVLDLFTGSGALSLESISRGAMYAVMVEHNRIAWETSQRNIASLGFESQCILLRMDYRQAISDLLEAHDRFDIIFLDPPYDMIPYDMLLSEVIQLMADDGIIVLEHPGKTTPPYPQETLRPVKERNWGYCGISIYQQMNPVQAEEV